MMNEARKLAVLFPGIGYTCDRPLLYYGGKLARSLGWEVLPVPYGGFPPKVRGDRARLRESAEIALMQAEECLRDVDWTSYGQVVFLSKSIGTVVAAAYADAHRLSCRHILFTPVEETFAFPVKDAVAFHGTADPWADTARIRELSAAAGIPLELAENANHSLETGDPAQDIRTVETVMRRVKAFLEGMEPRPEDGKTLRILRADQTWQQAGAYYVRIQAMAKKHRITLRQEFDGHDTPGTRYIVATEDDFPVATARLYPLDGTSVMIGRVVVLPEYRHRGLGTAVVRECEKWAAELGYTKAVLESRDNKTEFYLRQGYAVCGEAADGDTFRCVRMEKDL